MAAPIKCILAEQNRGTKKSMILKDEVTDAKYNLMVNDGVLTLQEISSTANEETIQLIDIATGRTYKLMVESAILKLEEV